MGSFTMRHADFVEVSGKGSKSSRSAPGSFPCEPKERVCHQSFLAAQTTDDLAYMKGLRQAENLKKCQKLSDCVLFRKESPERIRAIYRAMKVDPRLQAASPFPPKDRFRGPLIFRTVSTRMEDKLMSYQRRLNEIDKRIKGLGKSNKLYVINDGQVKLNDGRVVSEVEFYQLLRNRKIESRYIVNVEHVHLPLPED